MTQVHLRHLSKQYDEDDHAVFDLNLEIPSGSITALLGPSGCGKTTTLKMIAGLLTPTAGDITFDARSMLGIAAEKRGAVMVFQNHLLFPYMTVAENVGFGLKMRRYPTREIQTRVADMLKLVHLSGFEKRRPKQLSGGQQQRVALARALIVEPAVLLLDEPLSNLDAHLRDEMRELILDIQRQLQVTTIFVTHDQQEAVLLADRIALLFEGRLQQYAPPKLFYEQPVSVRVARFFGGSNFLPGRKSGTTIETVLGTFQGRRQVLPDGPATLTIRPESLQLDAGQTHNTVAADIEAVIYLGTHTRLKVRAAGHPFEVVGSAVEGQHYHRGQQVNLYFPPEHIWLVPPDASSETAASDQQSLEESTR